MSKKISVTIKIKKMKTYSIQVENYTSGTKINFYHRPLTKQEMVNFCFDTIKFYHYSLGHNIFITPFSLTTLLTEDIVCDVFVDINHLDSAGNTFNEKCCYKFIFSIVRK